MSIRITVKVWQKYLPGITYNSDLFSAIQVYFLESKIFNVDGLFSVAKTYLN